MISRLCPPTVQLDQVFTNLISNSVKCALAGTLIQIRARRGLERMLIQVANESPRVPPGPWRTPIKNSTRITHADKVMGTGLGLSICEASLTPTAAGSGRRTAHPSPATRAAASSSTSPCR